MPIFNFHFNILDTIALAGMSATLRYSRCSVLFSLHSPRLKSKHAIHLSYHYYATLLTLLAWRYPASIPQDSGTLQANRHAWCTVVVGKPATGASPHQTPGRSDHDTRHLNSVAGSTCPCSRTHGALPGRETFYILEDGHHTKRYKCPGSVDSVTRF